MSALGEAAREAIDDELRPWAEHGANVAGGPSVWDRAVERIVERIEAAAGCAVERIVERIEGCDNEDDELEHDDEPSIEHTDRIELELVRDAHLA